jgi:hypothetical protein
MFLSALIQKARGHRHLVVVPVFLVLATLSLREAGGSSMSARAVMAGSEGFIRAAGVIAMPLDGGEAYGGGSQIQLAKGSLLVSADGIAQVSAAGHDLKAWHGAFQATVQNGSLTVAALTSPVLVKFGEHRMIVPPGAQWKSPEAWVRFDDDERTWLRDREVKPLPSHFLRERFTLLASMPAAAPAAIVDADGTPLLDLLRLPGARERAGRDQRRAMLQSMLADPTIIREAAGDPSFEQALQEASFELLASLSSTVPSGIGSDRILSAFMAHEDGRLLVSAHPLSRDRAWVLDDGVDAGEDGLVRLFLLPQNDIGDQSMLPMALDRWEVAMATFLADRDDAATILAAWMPPAMARTALFAAQGHPLRAEEYHESIRSLAAPYVAQLDRSLFVSLDAVLNARQENVDMPVSAFGEGELEQEPQAPSPEVARAAEERATTMLRDFGALMTANSSFSALDADAVRVERVVFATAAGDKEATFTLHVEEARASNVLHEGAELPYDLPLADFLDWVKAGMELGA